MGAVVMMTIFSTIVIGLAWLWSYEITKNRKLAFLSALALLCMYSFNGLSGYIYPDIVVSGLLLIALLILQNRYQQHIYQAIFGLVLGLLALIHLKTLAISGPLAIVMVIKLWRKHKKLPWASLATGLPLVVYFFVANHGWFDAWNPTKIYGDLGLAPGHPIAIVSALLFDSMRGLLVYNPVLLLMLIGLPVWYKKSRDSLLIVLFVTVPSMLILAGFSGWNGGDSQIGRYTIDFLPALLPAIAFAVMALQKQWQKIVVIILFALTVFISLDSVKIKRPYVRSDVRSPIFVQIQDHTGVGLDKLLPTYNNQTQSVYPHGQLKSLIGFLMLVGLLAYGQKLSYQQKEIRYTKKKL
jgi:hypothetical protein